MLSEGSAAVSNLLDGSELWAGCEDARGVLAAISGGPDSTALLFLLDAWRKAPGRPPVFAATVDHGLRPDGREEAETVAAWCRSLGMQHVLLTWDGPKPETRIQERAREVRYALLAECARRVGASVLLTAHHADDQCETVLFRLLRGSGVSGLAGMARETLRGDLLHIRPLLGVPKAALTAYCERLGRPYFNDPSNQDLRFARVRARRALDELRRLGFEPEGLSRLARRAARCEAALRLATADLVASAVVERTDSRTLLRGESLAKAPEELALRCLCAELGRLTGRPQPRLEKVEAFFSSLRRALLAREPFRATLGGAVISFDKSGVELRRETRRAAQPSLREGGAHATSRPGVPPGSLVKGVQEA